ncbi:nucleolar protein dao-5-like isoform X3 [Spea bombifrons]|uniref:nucleolar protein dao-5-like isoform X3 n=1 Tax=Spea bombifrons TaxID=233779 RepID=UPI00234A1D15|nr:nucleolar protein dao-5-like isoform X3 [Spea bombifrons]
MKADGSLLALIHQHLVQAGYSKAARELQAQSGKKFSSPTVSLEDIFTDWSNLPENAKKRKAVSENDSQSKKPRVADPKSSSESSEEEDHPTGNAATSNLARGPSDSSESSSGSQSEMETNKKVRGKMASQTTISMGPTRSAVKKMIPDSNFSSPKKEVPATQQLKAKTISKATKQPVTQNPVKALAPIHKPADDSSENSDSDSEEEAKGKVVPAPQATPAKAKSSSKSTKQPVTPIPAKTAVPVQKPADDASESSDSDSGDETEVVPPPQATPAKAKASSKTTKQPVTPIPVKTAVPIQKLADDTSESSDSDSADEMEPVVPTPVKATKPIQKPADDSSESSDSDSEKETEPKKAVPPQLTPAKTIAPSKALLKQPVVPTPVKATKPIQKPADDSSESSDSDSEETEAKKAVPPQPTPGKTIPSSKAAKQPLTPTPVKAPVPIQKPEDDSSESSNSDSEAETETKVFASAQA